MPVVLITGSNRGLGLEFARQYGSAGWRVLACCRTSSPHLEAIKNVEIYRLDVTDHARVDALAKTLEGTPIDILINNAGVNGQAGMEDRSPETQAFGNTDYESFMQTLRVNLFGPMKMAESFVEHVAASEQKRLANLTSFYGSIAGNDTGAFYSYRASKAGVNAITKSMAIDLKDRGILAVALHPGWVATDLGGPNASIRPDESVSGMRKVLAALTESDSGKMIAYTGEVVPF